MRKYIDRAALFNSLSGAKTVEEIFAAIQAAPSADVQEIRRGRWIVHGEAPWLVVECSNCGAKWHHWSGEKTANYCGECGARMEADV